MSRKLEQAMRRYLRKTSLVTPVALLATMSATHSLGDQSQPSSRTGADSVIEEELVVLGIKRSLRQSLDTKRDADAIVDAITSEDIGKFPDKNVAESLSRITGVSVTRGFGEGEKISVRGTAPEQNRTLLNGASVASADWFVLDNPSRAFNYTLLPSNIVSSLEVYKSPQADIQEGSLGGTVYLRTRKPLELDANTVSLQLQAQYGDVSEEWDPQLSAMYSWKGFDDSFGVLFSLTRQDRTLAREGQEVLGFYRQEVSETDYWAPRVIGDAFFQQERERTTGLLSVQWAPSDAIDFTINYLDSEMDADNINHNSYAFFNSGFDESAAVIADGGVVAGRADNATAQMYVIDRLSTTETQSLDADFTFEGDGYEVHAKIGHTEAEGGTSQDRHHQFGRVLDHATFDQNLNLSFFVDENTLESDELLQDRPLEWLQDGSRLAEDEEDYVGFDFEKEISVGIINAFKVGAFYRDHDKSQFQDGTRFHWWADSQHAPGTTAYGQGDATNLRNWLSDLIGGQAPVYRDFVTGSSTFYPTMDRSTSEAIAYPDAAYDFPTATFLFLPNIWNVNEKIAATYGKLSFETDGIRGDLGVRVVTTDVDSTGYTWDGDWVGASIALLDDYQLLADLVDPLAGNARTAVQSHEYTDVLPNINAVLDLADDTLLRFSAARVMSRPDYITIAFQESANLTTQTGSRGNPFLDPIRANQFDIAYEWYFADASALTATFYYKDIKNSVFFETSVEPVFDDQNNTTVDVIFSQPQNGLGGTAQGFELSYQQQFGDFGVVGNYTYSDADSDQERDEIANPGSGLIIGDSQHMLNLTGFYENDLVSARLSYNYRTEYYDGVSEFGSEIFTDDYGQLDGSFTFRATDYLSVVVEAVNLLDEEIEQFHIDNSRPSKIYKNGRRFVIGVNMNF